MILGIGNDLLDQKRFDHSMRRFGVHFQQKHFDESEQEYCNARPSTKQKFESYGKRWAAKEACAKALGTGIAEGVYLRDIIVERDKLGKPSLRLQGGAAKRLSDLLSVYGLKTDHTTNIHLGLTDEKDLAQAFVVIEAL